MLLKACPIRILHRLSHVIPGGGVEKVLKATSSSVYSSDYVYCPSFKVAKAFWPSSGSFSIRNCVWTSCWSSSDRRMDPPSLSVAWGFRYFRRSFFSKPTSLSQWVTVLSESRSFLIAMRYYWLKLAAVTSGQLVCAIERGIQGGPYAILTVGHVG